MLEEVKVSCTQGRSGCAEKNLQTHWKCRAVLPHSCERETWCKRLGGAASTRPTAQKQLWFYPFRRRNTRVCSKLSFIPKFYALPYEDLNSVPTTWVTQRHTRSLVFPGSAREPNYSQEKQRQRLINAAAVQHNNSKTRPSSSEPRTKQKHKESIKAAH